MNSDSPAPTSAPVDDSLRARLRTRPRTFIVPIIIALNAGVYLLWTGAATTGSKFMERNFLTSWAALVDDRPWTLLTAAFSHNMFWHIFINMFVLRSFGTVLEVVLGARRFLLFYLCAGVFSSLCHCAVSNWILHDPSLEALGASGAIAGLVLVFSLVFPKERILLLGIIPVPAIFGALIFVGLDLYGLRAQAEGGGLPIGHGAHLGGALAGVIYYFLFYRPALVHKRATRIP